MLSSAGSNTPPSPPGSPRRTKAPVRERSDLPAVPSSSLSSSRPEHPQQHRDLNWRSSSPAAQSPPPPHATRSDFSPNSSKPSPDRPLCSPSTATSKSTSPFSPVTCASPSTAFPKSPATPSGSTPLVEPPSSSPTSVATSSKSSTLTELDTGVSQNVLSAEIQLAPGHRR